MGLQKKCLFENLQKGWKSAGYQRFSRVVQGNIIGLDGRAFVPVRENFNGSSFTSFLDYDTSSRSVEFPQETYNNIFKVKDKLVVPGRDNKSFFDFKYGGTIRKFPFQIAPVINKVDNTHVLREMNGAVFYDFSGEKLQEFDFDVSPIINDVHGEYVVRDNGGFSFYDFDSRREVRRFPVKVHDEVFNLDGRYAVKSLDNLSIIDYDTASVISRFAEPLHGRVNNLGSLCIASNSDRKSFYDLKTGDLFLRSSEIVYDDVGCFNNKFYLLCRDNNKFLKFEKYMN